MEKIEVDGQEFDVEPSSDAIRDVIIDRAPVAVIDELDLRDGSRTGCAGRSAQSR